MKSGALNPVGGVVGGHRLAGVPRETRCGSPRGSCTGHWPGVLTRSDFRVPRFATADLTGQTVTETASAGSNC